MTCFGAEDETRTRDQQATIYQSFIQYIAELSSQMYMF